MRTVLLPQEYDAFLDEKLASGHFATDRDVIVAALQALQEKEGELQSWLESDVSAAYDAMEQHPETAIPAADLRISLENRHADRMKANG